MKNELEIAFYVLTSLAGFILGRATSRRPHEKRSKVTGRYCR